MEGMERGLGEGIRRHLASDGKHSKVPKSFQEISRKFLGRFQEVSRKFLGSYIVKTYATAEHPLS
jgi:hypothetical protein